MKALKKSLVSVVAVGIVIALASSASAKFGGFGGGGGGGNKGNGGMKMQFGGNNNNHNKTFTNFKHHDNHHDNHNFFHHHHHSPWYYSRYYSYPYRTYYSRPVVITAPVIASAPSADISVAEEEPIRTQVPVGGVLMINGQALGSATGTVRLVFDNRSLPVQVLQWGPATAKIQLPKLTLSGPLSADLEVLRADGTLASKSAIEIMPVSASQAVGQ